MPGAQPYGFITPEPHAPLWELKGGGFGCFRADAAGAPRLVGVIEDVVAEGHDGADYEDTIARFMKVGDVGFERIGDLAWTEIDFSEDIVRAEREILPAIQAFEATE